MADPFSIFAGAASLADICFRAVQGIRQLQSDAGNIDGQLGSLAEEVEGLREICDTIQSRLEANGKFDQEYGRQAGDPRTQMARILRAAQQAVAKLHGIVQKISGPSPFATLGKVDAYRKAMRKMFQESDLRNCRVELAAYQQTLHLFLTIITKYVPSLHITVDPGLLLACQLVGLGRLPLYQKSH